MGLERAGEKVEQANSQLVASGGGDVIVTLCDDRRGKAASQRAIGVWRRFGARRGCGTRH